ncbi:MAG: glycosyltransferase family 39 protein [Candidatus Omnitrophica bacterium]|nr:glycosyltransferase family 39 protein [Candidatus Omnitrophota bacterium]
MPLAHNLFFTNTFYPPLYYYAVFLVKTLFSFISPKVILLTSCVFFIILLIYLYKLSELLYPGSGLLSSFICSFLPVMYVNSRFFNHVTAVCAMVIVNLYYLLKTHGFRKRCFSIILGFSFGIAMLVKYTFFVFLITPLAVIIYRTIKQAKNKEERYRLKNLALSASMATILAGTFYFNPEVTENLISRIFNMNKFAIADNAVNFDFFERLTFYFRFLIKEFLQSVAGILLAPAIVVFFIKNTPYRQLLSLTIFGSLLAVSLVPKYPPFAEYSMAIIPLMATTASIGLISIRINHTHCIKIKHLVIALLIIVLTIMYYQTEEGNPAFCFDNTDVEKIFCDIGNEKNHVGYFADVYDPECFISFEQFLVLWSLNKAKINNFFISPPDFFKSLDKYNTLIYVSRTDQDWPEFERLVQGIEFFCRQKNIDLFWNEFSPIQFDGVKLIISKKQLQELSDMKKYFIKTNQVKFFTNYSLTGPSVNIYVFNRITIDSKKCRNK